MPTEFEHEDQGNDGEGFQADVLPTEETPDGMPLWEDDPAGVSPEGAVPEGDGEGGEQPVGDPEGDGVAEGEVQPQEQPTQAPLSAVDQLQQQVNQLSNYMLLMMRERGQQPAPQAPAQTATPEPGPEPPTQEDVMQDPAAAFEKQRLYLEHKIAEQVNQKTSTVQRAIATRQAQEHSYNRAKEAFPEIDHADTVPRRLFEEAWMSGIEKVNGQAVLLNQLPDGPERIAARVKQYVDGLRGPQQSMEQAQKAGAVTERSRQARVKKGAMQGSGSGGGKAKVKLTPAQEAYWKRSGLTYEEYVEHL